MTTVIIDDTTPQGKRFLQYARTLPFATVKRGRRSQSSKWQQALEEGAVSVDEFVGELRRQVNEHYDNLDNA
jgi:succinyl-CoA synthetase alpha subunit